MQNDQVENRKKLIALFSGNNGETVEDLMNLAKDYLGLND